MNIVAISAGLGDPSSSHMLAERLATATGADQVRHVELRLVAHELVNALLTRVQSPALAELVEAVVDSDGLVVVSPVFNAQHSGLFKMFFDVLHEGALLDKPVLLAATGGSSRHSLAIDSTMLPLFFYLKAAVVPTSVFAATEDWGHSSSGLDDRIVKAAQELAEMVRLRSGDSLAERVDDEQPASRLAPAKKAKRADADDFTLSKSFQEMFDAI